MFRAHPRFHTRILSTHVAGMEYSAAKLLVISGEICRILRLSGNPTSISDNNGICDGKHLSEDKTVRKSNGYRPPRAAAAATSLHIEETITAVAQLSIPPLSGTKYP